jgi:bacterioferritin
MKGNPKVIEALNELLKGELTAINQYFLHARMCSHWGYERIGKAMYKESIDEMKHAQVLIDRILFLDGLPNLQALGRLNIGENVPEALNADLGLEGEAVPKFKAAIELCYSLSDHASREILEEILVDEERHVDWLESQLGLIKELGKEHYLAQQIKAEE